MRRNFLVGDFLPAYAPAFRYPERKGPRPEGVDADRLRERFADRASRHGEKNRVYRFRLQVGLAAALGLAVLVFRMDLAPTAAGVYVDPPQELVAMEEIVQTRQVEKPPPPPRPPVPVEVPDDVRLDDVDLDLDATLDIAGPAPPIPPPPPEPVEEMPEPEPEDEVFVVVEQMPEMVGGMARLVRDLVYPELARKAELEGTAVIQIVVNADGSPSDPKVVKSAGGVLDAAAVEAVMKQTFRPGRQRSRAVRVALNIPVVFRLN